MDKLTALNQANPHIKIYSIHDPEFSRYGRVIEEDTTAFCAAAETLPFPEEGSKYVASTPELDEIPELVDFASKLEQACIKTVESGKMTKSLAGISNIPNPVELNSLDFIKAIKETLETLL